MIRHLLGLGAFLRSALNRSTLQRLLGESRGVGSADKVGPDLAERWAGWLSMADAITLRQGLHSVVAAKVTAAPKRPDTADLGEALEQVRVTLTQSIKVASAMPVAPSNHGPTNKSSLTPLDATTEFTLLHQRYNDQQRRMDMSISALRAHVREVLSASSMALARLAMLDGVIDQMLRAREQNLLSTVPVFLKRRFEERRAVAPSESANPADADGHLWLNQLHTDFQQA